MSNTTRRHSLFEHARESWGAETAETLMDLLPEDRDELATKTDVRLLKADLDIGLAGVRAEMAQLGGELRAEMAQLGGELRVEMSQQTRLLMITMLTTTVTIVLAVLGSALAA